MKITVIGSGLIGISTAYFLSEQGMQVTVVDRQVGAGMETSFANGALLTPSMSDPWNAPGVMAKLVQWLGKDDAPMLLRLKALPTLMGWGLKFLHHSEPQRFTANLKKNAALASYSLSVMQGLQRQTGIDYSQSNTGIIKIFRDSKSLQPTVDLAKQLSPYGIEHRVLDQAGVIQQEPALAAIGEQVAGGIYYPNDESGDAYQYCQQLHRLCEARGVIFRFGETVQTFKGSSDQVKTVITDKGQWDTDALVIAAGSYSPALVRSLGIKLPVKPVKGYSLTVPAGDWLERPTIPVIDDQLHAAVVPVANNIRVAGTAEFTGFDTRIDQGRIDNLLGLLESVYPVFTKTLDLKTLTPWAGLRPVSADGVPIIGKTAVDNVYLNTGHGHLGWTMAAGSGKALADLISGRKAGFDIRDYGFYRFS